MGVRARQTVVGRMTVSIDAAQKDDVAAISEIERAAFSDPWSARSFRDALEHPSVYFGCARSDAG